jgi:hypothetical protein
VHVTLNNVQQEDEFCEDVSLLASQQGETHKPQTPEVDLWRAVLEQSLKDLNGDKCGAHLGQNVAREARDWFSSDDEDAGSFHFVCGVLNLNPEAVRDALRARGVPTRGLPSHTHDDRLGSPELEVA